MRDADNDPLVRLHAQVLVTSGPERLDPGADPACAEVFSDCAGGRKT